MSPLHITNGDHAAGKLRRVVDGTVALACDILHDGPCPPVDGEAWHEVRARFLAGPDRPAAAVRASLAADDRAIGLAVERGDALVLWFEHDLFDQLALIRTLDLIARLAPDAAGAAPDVSLIGIDRFPGVDRFIGLGQLTTDQLATLTGTGATVTRGHFALAADAWRAFRSPDPSELMRIAMQLDASRVASSEGGRRCRSSARRCSGFSPSTRPPPMACRGPNSSRSKSSRGGPLDAGALFAATQAREARPFLGDLPFFDRLQRLASARVPLVDIDGGDQADPRGRLVAITDAGRNVLAGNADHVRLNGIDLWRGGVHLVGSNQSPWRWDADGETLVS